MKRFYNEHLQQQRSLCTYISSRVERCKGVIIANRVIVDLTGGAQPRHRARGIVAK